jgi:hypothetical protein
MAYPKKEIAMHERSSCFVHVILVKHEHRPELMINYHLLPADTIHEPLTGVSTCKMKITEVLTQLGWRQILQGMELGTISVRAVGAWIHAESYLWSSEWTASGPQNLLPARQAHWSCSWGLRNQTIWFSWQHRSSRLLLLVMCAYIYAILTQSTISLARVRFLGIRSMRARFVFASSSLLYVLHSSCCFSSSLEWKNII